MTDHPLWDKHAKQGLTRGLLVPPISYPKLNHWCACTLQRSSWR